MDTPNINLESENLHITTLATYRSISQVLQHCIIYSTFSYALNIYIYIYTFFCLSDDVLSFEEFPFGPCWKQVEYILAVRWSSRRSPLYWGYIPTSLSFFSTNYPTSQSRFITFIPNFRIFKSQASLYPSHLARHWQLSNLLMQLDATGKGLHWFSPPSFQKKK